MRRLFFVAVVLLSAGAGGWLRHQGSASSFGPYTGAQLDTLEAGYRAAMPVPPLPGVGPRALAAREASIDAEVSLGLLEAERHRRKALLGVLAVAVLGTLGALIPRRGGPAASGDEERRLARAMGSPTVLLEGERHRAAKLLGVALEAPPAVIDAALAAQLAAHDLGHVDGLAPDLRKMMLEQRESLRRARDLLVTGSAPTAAGQTTQQ